MAPSDTETGTRPPEDKESRRGGIERRRHPRYEIPGALLQFGYPAPLGHHCEQPLKDLSLGGIAFEFPPEGCLGRIRVGQVIRGIRLVAGDITVSLDLLVVRITRASDGTGICGGFAYWKTVEDFERVKGLVARAESCGTPA